MIPVRCWTCGALVADKLKLYQETKSLDSVRRYCCKRMLVGYVDTVTPTLAYVHEVHDPPAVAALPERVLPSVD